MQLTFGVIITVIVIEVNRAQAYNVRSYDYFIFNFYANVLWNVIHTGTASINYYITTKFEYVNVLQQFEFIKVCLGKNRHGNQHYNWNCDILAINLTYLNVLLFFLLSFHFLITWSKAFKASLMHFWFSTPEKRKGSTLDSGLLTAWSEKKHWKHASHPSSSLNLVIMPSGPAINTFEAWTECWANKLTLSRGRQRTVLNVQCTLLHCLNMFCWHPHTESLFKILL